MPISKREYELGVDSVGLGLMLKVYKLLENTKELAYSEAELRGAILDSSFGTQEANQFSAAIHALVRISAIETRTVADVNYYAFFREFDTENWEPPVLRVI